MKLVHRFVVSFFENPECFEGPCKNPTFEPKWFDKYMFKEIDGDNSVFVEKQRLYDSFQWWRKHSGLTLNAKISTFRDDLAEIGIAQTRKTVEGRKLTGVVFGASFVRLGLKRFYKLDSIKMDWCWLPQDDFDKYKKKQWRYR